MAQVCKPLQVNGLYYGSNASSVATNNAPATTKGSSIISPDSVPSTSPIDNGNTQEEGDNTKYIPLLYNTPIGTITNDSLIKIDYITSSVVSTLDNYVNINGVIGLYKPDINPLTGDTLLVSFGYIPVGGGDGDFKVWDSRTYQVTDDLEYGMTLNTFYNQEFGTELPVFDFTTKKTIRFEFTHKLYDYRYYDDSSIFVSSVIKSFAFKFKFLSNTNTLSIGVACGIINI